jgi:peptidoglycan/LPS O-acetylase OafA/YrhL
MERRDYQRARLEFLDGLRAFLAIKVALLHAGYFFILPQYAYWFGERTFAVASFITISGFVLYLPSAAAGSVMMKRSFGEYLKRRAIRLLPAWYAGLLFACLILSVMAWLKLPRAMPFEQSWPSLLWHASFLHSWHPEHIFSLNSALWFMGFELQLSLLLPLFLLLARRFGWWVLLLIGIGLTLPLSGPLGIVRTMFSPTLTFPFIVGIIAARIARRPDLIFHGFNERKIAICVCCAFIVSTALYIWSDYIERGVLISCFASLACASFLVQMTYFKDSWWQRVLSSRPLKFIGGFSYSLFLVHEPVARFVGGATRDLAFDPTARLFLVFLPCMLLILALSYLFYLAFERPFIRWNERRKQRPITASNLS